jgi:thiol-disulfide isomerase/thioredoxin
MEKQTLFLFLFLHTLASYAQVTTLQGKVIDSLTQKGIPYVNIGFPKLSIGTSANEEGVFVMKITPEQMKDTLVFSSIGYQTYKVVVKDISEAKKQQTILLKANEINLNEFVVQSKDAQKLIQMTLKKRKENYNVSPVSLQVFCRETIKEKDSDTYFANAEGLLDVYKSSVEKNADAVKLIKGRKKQLTTSFIKGAEKYEMPKIVEAPHIPILLDVIKASDLFIDNYKQFRFTQVGYENISNHIVYVVLFEPKNHNFRILDSRDADFFQGKMYIDTASYALIRADYELSPRGIRAANMDFKMKQTPMFLKRRAIVINYTDFNDRWYFKSGHLENEYTYYSNNEKKLTQEERIDLANQKFEDASSLNPQDSLLTVIHKIESLVTEIKTENVKKISLANEIEQDVTLGDNIEVYDDSFWEDYNFIKAPSEQETSMPIESNIGKDHLTTSQPISQPTSNQKRIKSDKVFFSEISLENAMKLAANQKKFVFVDVYADWCSPCKKMAAQAFTDSEIAEKMNISFINLKMDADRGGKDFAQKHGVKYLPTTIILDSTGKIIQEERGYNGVVEFGIRIDKVVKKIPKANLYMKAKEALVKDTKDFDSWIQYAIVRKGLGLSNDFLTDLLIEKLPADTLKQPYFQQFLTTYATQVDSKTFKFFLSHKDVPIYANKMKKMIQQNLEWAAETEDLDLLSKVLKANVLVVNNPSVKEAENERLMNLYKEKVKQKKVSKSQ